MKLTIDIKEFCRSEATAYNLVLFVAETVLKVSKGMQLIW